MRETSQTTSRDAELNHLIAGETIVSSLVSDLLVQIGQIVNHRNNIAIEGG
jgi:hypothetical protein